MTENTTASGAADLTPEIEYDCLVAWNRSVFGANQHDTVHPMYLTAFKSGYKAALAASAPAPQPAVPLTDTFVQTVPDKCDRIVWRNSYYHLPIAAAPKAAPAINKVSDIIDAYGMTPGQPERVADIPGLAEALEAAFADGSAQVTGALQQGEYLPLPVPSGRIEYPAQRYEDAWVSTQDAYSEEQMHAYVDADRAARGAAQAAQAALAEPDMRSVALAAGDYTTAYSMMMYAEAHNADVDGSTKRLVAAINGLRSALGPSAPVAEDAEDAARYRWLKLQARPNEPFELFDKLREAHALVKAFDVFCTRWGGWDASIDAARAHAAQPEGGA